MKKRIEVDVDVKSSLMASKSQFIASLMEEESREGVSKEYIKSRTRYIISEVRYLNFIIGLPENDGIEKWV